ncbi:MAG: YdcF family protein [Actinomycetes bacterium]|jgi:vancomycin permeability regulator SanA|nr:YdcF family protein [Actinomycetes bacterium]
MKHILRSIARGAALFFGCFSAINLLVSKLGTARAEDIWWISFHWLPGPVVTVLQAAAACLLLAFALKPALSHIRLWATTVACGVYVFFALVNVFEYYVLLFRGSFQTTIPVPFSLLVLLLFIGIVAAAWKWRELAANWSETVIMLVCAVAGALLFPLIQFYTFGKTDYRRSADVVVVFGARAHPDGVLSNSLRERVDTAIDLYESDLVDKLLFTGGVDSDGINEVEQMKTYAVRNGVPAADILLDDGGVDTDHSVANTVPMLEDMGAKTVLAVSQFYHLPRIKMAYRAAHYNVITVPAKPELSIPGTPYFVGRETLAFWAYWVRSATRDVGITWTDTLIKGIETKLHQ